MVVGNAEGLGEAALRIGDGADDVGEEDDIEGLVGKGEIEGISLDELRVFVGAVGTDKTFIEFALCLMEHAGGEVDAGDFDVGRIILKRKAGADADVEDAVARVKGDCGNGLGEAAFEEHFEAVVKAAIEIVNA